MRNVFFLLLLCSSCSDSPHVTTAYPDAGKTKPSSSGGGPGAGGATMTMDASPPSGGCGDKAPTKCPGPPPSFTKDVLPIFDAKCNNCHLGEPGPWSLVDYEHIRDWRLQILMDIEGCTMPPLDAGTTLSADERRTLFNWLVCDVPNN